ncbi:Oidioi.mRNA.OKI2018_I69.PAR.g8849.t1.cds [Oikopleura dioica]|uniref:Oidioi.mRNA.OKI2018_I69.PAR.g8849.t1.cds n=1 Tax=Oikopleura dioica TaxID=34765 RepID=A0ABN7RNX0_OIKDI|nr:Oidioi.mRNA.OKI2018_I69.PAR.g8849.t1.cds [Oikopleura dioica]
MDEERLKRLRAVSIQSYCERHHWDRRLTATGNLKAEYERNLLTIPSVFHDPFVRPSICWLLTSVCFLISICALFSSLQLWSPNETRKIVISFERDDDSTKKNIWLYPYLIALPIVSLGVFLFSIIIFIRALKMRSFIQGKIQYYNAMIKVGEEYRPFGEEMNLKI